MRPGKRRVLDKSTPMGTILYQCEQAKARIRAKVEHPFRVIKRQFGHVKVRYLGLAKNTAQQHTLFALSNLWMVRRSVAAGDAGMSASAGYLRAPKRGRISFDTDLASLKLPPSEIKGINSRCGGCCADLP